MHYFKCIIIFIMTIYIDTCIADMSHMWNLRMCLIVNVRNYLLSIFGCVRYQHFVPIREKSWGNLQFKTMKPRVKCENVQFLEWPLSACSKRESISLEAHVNFTTDLIIFVVRHTKVQYWSPWLDFPFLTIVWEWFFM